MDNISKRQLYYGQNPQQDYQQQQKKQQQQYNNYAGGNNTLTSAKDVAVSQSNVGYIAGKFDVFKHPEVLVSSFLLSLASAVGITRGANFLMRGDMKEGVSNTDSVKQSRLYKLGKKLDNFIEKTPVLKKALDGCKNMSSKLKAAKKPAIWNEIVAKYKEGTIAPWDKSLMYQEGKGAEAYSDFYDYLKEVSKEDIQKIDTEIHKKTGKENVLKDIMHKVDAGEMKKTHAAKELAEGKYLNAVDAKFLDEIQVGKSGKTGKAVDKMFGTTPNLNMALTKTKFFNNKMDLGPVSKAINKIGLMFAEGTGGGILGGKAALAMSIVGLITSFNAVAKSSFTGKEKKKAQQQALQAQQNQAQQTTFGAGRGAHGANDSTTDTIVKASGDEKPPWTGEAIASFMEDFAGFMVGGYIMTFPLGVAMNKSLGLANIGRDEKAVKDAAKHMNVKATDKLYQNTVIEYNNAIKHDKQAKKWIKFLETGKLPLGRRILKAVGISDEKSYKAKIAGKMKEKMYFTDINEKSSTSEMISALKTKERSKEWFKDTRAMIKKAGKSHLTLKSVFVKGNSVNKGSFVQRLGRYVTQKPLEIAAKLTAKGRFTLLNRNWTPKNFFGRTKKIGGGVGRIAIVALGLTVPFRNAFMKMSHAIFGKPSFSQYDEVKGVYDKQEEQAKKAQQLAQLKQAQSMASAQPAQASKRTIKLTPNAPVVEPQEPKAVPNVKPQDNIQESSFTKNRAENAKSEVRKLDTYTYVPSFD